MTIATRFHDYQHGEQPLLPASCSPALVQLRHALASRWSMNSLGCFGVRDIRLGDVPSTHSYGAAVDLSYRLVGRSVALNEILPYLVAWSAEWGIQAIHDYVGSRIWRAGRTATANDACSTWWRAQRPGGNGMGQAWADYFHVEVHPDRWHDDRTESERAVL